MIDAVDAVGAVPSAKRDERESEREAERAGRCDADDGIKYVQIDVLQLAYVRR